MKTSITPSLIGGVDHLLKPENGFLKETRFLVINFA
jgi:hypothetical protein